MSGHHDDHTQMDKRTPSMFTLAASSNSQQDQSAKDGKRSVSGRGRGRPRTVRPPADFSQASIEVKQQVAPPKETK